LTPTKRDFPLSHIERVLRSWSLDGERDDRDERKRDNVYFAER